MIDRRLSRCLCSPARPRLLLQPAHRGKNNSNNGATPTARLDDIWMRPLELNIKWLHHATVSVITTANTAHNARRTAPRVVKLQQNRPSNVINNKSGSSTCHLHPNRHQIRQPLQDYVKFQGNLTLTHSSECQDRCWSAMMSTKKIRMLRPTTHRYSADAEFQTTTMTMTC